MTIEITGGSLLDRVYAMNPIRGYVIVSHPIYGPIKVVCDGSVFGSKEDAMRVALNMIETTDEVLAIADIGVVATKKREEEKTP